MSTYSREQIVDWALSGTVTANTEWFHDHANAMAPVDMRLAILLRELEEAHIALKTYAKSVKDSWP